MKKTRVKIGAGFAVVLSVAVLGSGLFAPTKVFADPLPNNFEIATVELIHNRHTIGNQGQTSLCWAYSSAKALETYLYSQTNQEYNLSEAWTSLAYMNYVNDSNVDLIDIAEYEQKPELHKAPDNREYEYNGAGLVFYFERAVNAYGIMLENNFIAPTQNVTSTNVGELFAEQQSNLKTNIVEDISFEWIGRIERNNQFYAKAEFNQQQKFDFVLTSMKEYLVNKGALVTSINSQRIVSDGGYVYHSYDDTIDHALTIIGYDDNQVTNIGGGETKTGAFKAINSHGTQNRVLYIPYEMYEPHLVGDERAQSENNVVLSNTFFLSKVTLSQSGSETGGGADGEVVPPDGGQTPEGETTANGHFFDNIWNDFQAKTPSEQAFVVGAVGMFVLMVLFGIGVGVVSLFRKRHTTSINQNVLAHNFARYQAHRLELERQKIALDEEIAQIRAEAKRKKQRRLKRQFNKKLNTEN